MADDFVPDAPASNDFTPDAGAQQPGAGRAMWEGVKAGATAGWGDQLTGLMAAGGLGQEAQYLTDEQLAEVEKAGGVPGVYATARDEARTQRETAQAAHPYYYGAGQVGGAGLTMAVVPGGALARGAGFIPKAVQAGRVGAGYGALEGAAVGEREGGLPGAAVGAVTGGVEGALGGAGGSALGAGVGAVSRLGYDAFGRPLVGAVRGYIDPLAEAGRRVAGAWASDIPQALAGVGRGLTPSQYVEALKAGEPVLPADMGETSRALMRWAANADPEARAIISDAVGQRFAEQNQRGGALIRDLVAGGANTAKTAAQLEAEYDAERGGAYGAAYAAGDRPVWSPELERLSSSPAVAGAIRGAVNRWKDFQVKDGFGAMNPPVNVTADGQLQFLPGKGLMPYPNIQFWDYAARNLAGMASAARRAGNNTDAGLYGGLEQQLKAELDRQVPEFANARGVAARYFGGNNAIDAGQAAVNFKGDIRELQRAVAQMRPAERGMFQEAYADALARRVENMSDNQSIVNRVYQSPQERQRISAVLGPGAADRLGAFVDRERIFDAARQALGNSTTVRQMVEMGLAGSLSGGAAGYLTGDWHNIGPAAMAGVAARSGFRSLVGYVDRNTARRVAELLTSPDPRKIMAGIEATSTNPRLSAALRETASRAAAGTGAQGAIGYMPKLQLPAPAAAEPNQQNVPGPPGQQQNSGAVERQPRARGGAIGDDQKSTKRAAHYGGGTKEKRCAQCTMFVAPDGCTAVKGKISPWGVCKFFDRKSPERAVGGRVEASNIDTAPTEAQKKAGNYAKDHVCVHGLDISIENAKGHYRRGVGRDGKPWQVRMPSHYGYIKKTVGKDKDHVDVYLGPHPRSPSVWVVDQMDADSGKFDEHKVFLGFASKHQVVETYRKAFSDGRAHERMGHLTRMSVETFKRWLERGDMTKTVDEHFPDAPVAA